MKFYKTIQVGKYKELTKRVLDVKI